MTTSTQQNKIDPIHHTSVAKTIGVALDTIVKTAGKQPLRCIMGARRVLSMLPSQPVVLRFDSDVITIDGDVALQMDDGQHMWILPLYIVGVRAITLDMYTSTEEIIALGYEISALRLDTDAMESFRDWIWSDGLGSIQVDITETFMDVMELMDAENPEELRGFGLKGAQVRQTQLEHIAMSLNDQELTVATLRPEFQASVDLFTQGMKYRGFEMIDEERQALASSSASEAHWVVSTLNMLLHTPSVQAFYPPMRFANVLRDTIARHLDAQTLAALLELQRHGSAYANALFVCLTKDQLGATLGEHINLHMAAQADLLGELWQQLPEDQRAQLRQTLLGRYVDAQAVEPCLKRFVEGITLAQWTQDVSLEAMPPERALGFVQSLVAVSAPPPMVESYAQQLPHEMQVRLIEHLPAIYLKAFELLFKRFFEQAERRHVEHLLGWLLAHKFNGVLEQVATIMLTKKDITWSRKTLTMACEAIYVMGTGKQRLVSMVRSRSVAIAVREVALETLERFAEDKLLLDATEFRISELFDPPAFRERIKTGRTRIKTRTKPVQPIEKS